MTSKNLLEELRKYNINNFGSVEEFLKKILQRMIEIEDMIDEKADKK